MMASFGLLAVAMATAPVQDVTDFDRFSLFNNCESMFLLVESLGDDAADIGLTKERLQVAAESRFEGRAVVHVRSYWPTLPVREC